VPLPAVKSEASPPFQFSPYGQGNVCTDPN